MIKVFFEVCVEHRDYFDHFRSTDRGVDSRRFESLVDAFKFYKESKCSDYCWYGDHEKITYRPVRKFVYVPDIKQSKHGYVRGHKHSMFDGRIEDKYSHYKKYRLHYDAEGLVVDLPGSFVPFDGDGDYFDDDDLIF